METTWSTDFDCKYQFSLWHLTDHPWSIDINRWFRWYYQIEIWQTFCSRKCGSSPSPEHDLHHYIILLFCRLCMSVSLARLLQLCSAMFSCWFCSCLPCFYGQCFGGWLDIPSGSVRGVHVQMTSAHLFGRGSDHSASLVELPMAESNRSDCHDPERFGCNTYRYIWNIYRT